MHHNFNHKLLILRIIIMAAFLALVVYLRQHFAQIALLGEKENVSTQANAKFNMIEDGHLLSLKLANLEKENVLVCYRGLPFVIPIKLQNHSQAILHSGHEPIGGVPPVNIGYRLYQQGVNQPKEGQRNFLPQPLDPNDGEQDLSMIVNCPSEREEYYLSVQMVQEGVAWQVDAKRGAVFLDRVKLEVRELFSSQTDTEKIYSQKMTHLLFDETVPEEIKKVSLGAFRLLESSRQVASTSSPHYLLSRAGSQYPMFWVRDLATIQRAFLNYLDYEKGQKKHWSELFFSFQGPELGVPDWVALKLPNQIRPSMFDKNTVTSDQELWLLYAIFSAIEKGRIEPTWLSLKTNHLSHFKYIERALRWLLKNRLDPKHSCIMSGHTIDWGDVGPYGHDNSSSTKIEFGGSKVCSTYSQALFVLVSKQIKKFVGAHKQHPFSAKFLHDFAFTEDKILAFITNHLWLPERGFFKIHHPVEPSTIPGDKSKIFALGAQVLAYEAGLMQPDMQKSVVKHILRNQEKYKVTSISGVLFPAYPKGVYQNPIIQPYEYQNGGQWDWFGARATLMIAQHNSDLAKSKLKEIASKVLANGTFYEWEHLDGSPGAGPHFRAGAASFLIAAIELFGQTKLKDS